MISVKDGVFNYYSKVPKGWTENNWELLAKESPKKGAYIKEMFFSQIEDPDGKKNRFIFGVRFPYLGEIKYKGKKKDDKDPNKMKSWFFYTESKPETDKWVISSAFLLDNWTNFLLDCYLK